MDFHGKTFLLIGVSKGFGYALSYFLVKNRAEIILVSRDKEKLEYIKNNLEKYGKVYIISTDISLKENLDKLKNEVKKIKDKINGIAIMIGGYEEDNIENPYALDQMINNHIKYPINIINTFLDILDKGSTILLISAIKGIDKALPNQLSYSIAKAGIAKAVEVLASELLNKEIRVVGIAPSWIDGEFIPERDWRSLRKLGDPKAPPEDFAIVGAWLMSEESEWINGVVIPVDGGYRLR
ncbi:3-ketoacyl-ACP reductase [Nanoarchaeota archaeon]